MRLTRLKIVNYARLHDLDIEVRKHLVIVGANDVGKTSLLRMLNLTLGATLGQLYQSLSRADLRDQDQPLTVETVLADFSDTEGALFHREIDIDADSGAGSLTVRLEVQPNEDDVEAVVIHRVLTGTADRRAPTRQQLEAFGWRYLPATRGTSGAQLGGPNSALQLMFDSLDMGAERAVLTGILSDFNDKLHVSESLTELRRKIAGHLAKAMPRPVTANDLAVRTAADPGASMLEGVSMFLHRDDQYVPIAEQSDGLRQLMALTLFDLAENAANIIAVDEPELHLHPASQRTIAELFAAAENQKIVCTHSPYVLQRFEPAQVLVVAPGGDVHQVPDGSLGAVEKLRAQWWSPRLLEALTARYVIAVEGVADRIIVEAAARALGIGLDRLGVVVFELDGADKFRHVYKMLGENGFGVHVLGLVDKAEEGIFLGAIGGRLKDLIGTKVWSSDSDLEDEYCKALTGPGAGRILIDAGVCRLEGLLQACGASSEDELTSEAVAAYCRRNKTDAAIAVADAMTREQAEAIGSVAGILTRAKELAGG
ncbi:MULTISPECIES: ATP-dependent nuclease [Streptomyces]|uniref:AAA family ATPase n=1 Tax=Streptomyces albidoflavus TaxID=1886 RepID=A0ABY3H3D7_9ACTN|nr:MULTISPECIES: AAA family ATPase [Streptomyces]TWV26708.1 AAA family ATPase [Streptomyces albidoflavus]UKL03114.1 AAA family ATPase [Streptomyces sp. NBU3104]